MWKARDVEFDVARIDEIEAVTKHDVIAFLTHLAEHVGADQARFVHQGMTSSDVLDTTFNVQLTRAADILIAGLERVLAALKARAGDMLRTEKIKQTRTRKLSMIPTDPLVMESPGSLPVLGHRARRKAVRQGCGQLRLPL